MFLCPEGMTVPEAVMDVRIGGAYRIAMRSADGEPYVVRGIYREVEPGRRLVMTWEWEEDDLDGRHESMLTVEFAPYGNGTELTLTHQRLASAESRDRHESGWNSILNRLNDLRTFAITGLDVSGYMVKDAPRAIAFYRDVLGLTPARLYADDRGAEFDFPEGTFCLWGGGGKSPIPFQPSNGVLFAVDDLDAAVTALKGRAIPIVAELQTPICRMAALIDTEGNTVFLHERKQMAPT